MTYIKKQHERLVGDRFIDWKNLQEDRYLIFVKEGENPDLTYRDKKGTLNIEVTSAYYDERQSRMLWENARAKPNAPQTWGGINFSDDLLEDVNRRLAEKCLNDYGKDCVLLIDVYPFLTTAEECENLLRRVIIPQRHHFAGIYVVGNFPIASNSPGGYRCWKLA